MRSLRVMSSLREIRSLFSSDPQLDFRLETDFTAILVQDRVLDLKLEGFTEFLFPRVCVSVLQLTCYVRSRCVKFDFFGPLVFGFLLLL